MGEAAEVFRVYAALHGLLGCDDLKLECRGFGELDEVLLMDVEGYGLVMGRLAIGVGPGGDYAAVDGVEDSGSCAHLGLDGVSSMKIEEGTMREVCGEEVPDAVAVRGRRDDQVDVNARGCGIAGAGLGGDVGELELPGPG